MTDRITENRGDTGEAPREFHWLIHDECNYSCPYCPRAGGKRPPGPPKRNTHSAEEWLAAWNRVRDTYGRCRVYITGGEPTLFSGFAPLVRGLSAIHSVVIDTNLSLDMAALEDFSSWAPPEAVQVNLSFHPHTADRAAFIKKALLLRAGGFGASCRVVAFPPLLPDIPSHCDAFREAGLELAVTPFRGIFSEKKYPMSYTEEEKALIAGLNSRLRPGRDAPGFQTRITRRILYPRMIPPTGRQCRSGEVYCCVEHDGTVYRCMQYAHRVREPLGSLLGPGFRLADGPSPCSMRYCEYERKYLVRGPGTESRGSS